MIYGALQTGEHIRRRQLSAGAHHHIRCRAETRAEAIPDLNHVMDRFLLLRFAHLVGLMLISAGLIGVFVTDMRSRQVRDVKLFAQAVTFIAVFYDGLVVPGALLLLASGTWLIVSYYEGWQFLNVPWLVGMVVLFAFEFIEGNTITRLYFMRLRRLARAAVAEGG